MFFLAPLIFISKTLAISFSPLPTVAGAEKFDAKAGAFLQPPWQQQAAGEKRSKEGENGRHFFPLTAPLV